MEALTNEAVYRTSPSKRGMFARTLPTPTFYSGAARVILRGAQVAKRGSYDDERWVQDSQAILRLFERLGGQVEVENLEALQSLDKPCVFIGNHMSVLETFVLPGFIRPFMPVTYVVKRSLVEYPLFKHVMRSRNPIVVGRENPREDLRVVMTEGEKHLRNGTALIVFPQRTRVLEFEPKSFNSIGVKLARRAKAPVVPLALKTDAWGIGFPVKDFGRIDPSKKVRFAFGEPMEIKGTGKEEHALITKFISDHLARWQKEQDEQ